MLLRKRTNDTDTRQRKSRIPTLEKNELPSKVISGKKSGVWWMRICFGRKKSTKYWWNFFVDAFMYWGEGNRRTPTGKAAHSDLLSDEGNARITFVTFDVVLLDGQVELDVMLVVADDTKEFELVLVENLKQTEDMFYFLFRKRFGDFKWDFSPSIEGLGHPSRAHLHRRHFGNDLAILYETFLWKYAIVQLSANWLIRAQFAFLVLNFNRSKDEDIL